MNQVESMTARPRVLYLTDQANPAKIVAWACGTCRIVRHDENSAAGCCEPRKCSGCGIVVDEKWYTACRACRDKQDTAKEAARVEKAEKVTTAGLTPDFVFCPHCDEYYSDIDTFFDGHGDITDPDDFPTYVWATKMKTLSLDARDIVFRGLEADFHEDAGSGIANEDFAVLQSAIDLFIAENRQDLTSYEEDYGRAVLIEDEVQEHFANLAVHESE